MEKLHFDIEKNHGEFIHRGIYEEDTNKIVDSITNAETEIETNSKNIESNKKAIEEDSKYTIKEFISSDNSVDFVKDEENKILDVKAKGGGSKDLKSDDNTIDVQDMGTYTNVEVASVVDKDIQIKRQFSVNEGNGIDTAKLFIGSIEGYDIASFGYDTSNGFIVSGTGDLIALANEGRYFISYSKPTKQVTVGNDYNADDLKLASTKILNNTGVLTITDKTGKKWQFQGSEVGKTSQTVSRAEYDDLNTKFENLKKDFFTYVNGK